MRATGISKRPTITSKRLEWRSPPGPTTRSSSGFAGVDWTGWLGEIERKRLRLARLDSAARRRKLPDDYYASATFASFRLDGIDLTETDVISALHRGVGRSVLLTRPAQRIRNHVSILHRIEPSLHLGESLKAAAVMRWYTTIGSGLINTALTDAVMDRLDHVVRRINSPQMRMQPALIDIAKLHVLLLRDPLVPSFNGILSRLLMRYHLGRIGLPPIVFDPDEDAPRLLDDTMLLARMLELLNQSCDRLLQNEPM